ncbi:MAG: adenylyltransferase/cytidyltransferase family protein [Candidatus Paceibacterota bacterium]
MIRVTVSGGFDPLHIGHLRMMQEAKTLGDYLIVIVNNDNWLNKKKGYTFMPENERVELIEGLACVDEVVLSKHKPNPDDMSVCNELRDIQPDIFANGGDRFSDNTPEKNLCDELGIDTVFNVGGGKIRSSSELVNKCR